LLVLFSLRKYYLFYGKGRLTSSLKLKQQQLMATKLFVGSLPFKTTDEELKQLFAEAGNVVSANIITDRETGRSRGFGFVEFDADEDAQKAIEMFNGKELDGREIVVNEARAKQ
jgi:RNA recognition motif-containing protein